MKISFLVLKGLPFPGGVERYTEEVGSRLAARGHAVRVYSIGYRTQARSTHRGMDVRTVSAFPLRSLEKLSAAFAAAARECFDDADVVHVHAFGPSIAAVLPCIAGKKVVVQGHGLEWQRSKWGWGARTFLLFCEMLATRLPTALTVVSQTQQRYLRSRYGVDATYIPPGVAPPSAAPPREILPLGLRGRDYILFAARLEREKGLHYLIEAYRSVATDVKLVIAGDNPLDDRYKREMHALASGDARIVFTGFATGRLLRELFSNCCLFVLPSELEGLPLAALEAMSYGCACLVSDIPENQEAVGGHGFTFRSRDPVDLARRLRSILADPELANEKGRLARDYVLSAFSWDTAASELETLYRACLETSGGLSAPM